jgi:quinol monooxygenase YgiN
MPDPMHGLINRFTAHPGQRDAAIAAFVAAPPPPGCLSFVVALDPTHPDAFYVTEAWSSRASWAAQFDRPEIASGIDAFVPLIADWGTEVETIPVKVLP